MVRARFLVCLLVSVVARQGFSFEIPSFVFNPGDSVFCSITEHKTTSHISDSVSLFSVNSKAVASFRILRTGSGYRVTDSLIDFTLSFGSDTSATRVKDAFNRSVVVLNLDSNGLAYSIADDKPSLERLDSTISPGWSSIVEKAHGDGDKKDQQWNRRVQPLLGEPIEIGAYFFNEGEYYCLANERFHFFEIIRVVDTLTVDGIVIATLVSDSHTRPADLARITGLETGVVAETFALTPDEWGSLDTISAFAHVRTEWQVEIQTMLPRGEKSITETSKRRTNVEGREVEVRLVEKSEITFEYLRSRKEQDTDEGSDSQN